MYTKLTKSITKTRLLVPLFALLFGAAHTALATPIITGASGANGTSANSVRGFEFTTTQEFTVTHLSIYDQDGLGLNESHELALWDSGQTLLASGIIAAGAGAPLSTDSLWRLLDITDFIIQPGTYITGAVFLNGSSDSQFINRTGTLAGTSWVQGRFINGSPAGSLVFPTRTITVGLGGGGVELAAVSAPVPTPATLALFGLGLASLGWSRRKKA